MIEDYFGTDFTIKTRTEVKLNGRNKMEYIVNPSTFKCAIFTPSTHKVVRFGGQDFITSKNLYCDVVTPLVLGDIVTINGEEYDVISITNNVGHHLAVGVVSRD